MKEGTWKTVHLNRELPKFLKENQNDKRRVLIAIYTAENCHSPLCSVTNDAKERAKDQMAHLNSAIRTLPQFLAPLMVPLPQFLAFRKNVFNAPAMRPFPK